MLRPKFSRSLFKSFLLTLFVTASAQAFADQQSYQTPHTGFVGQEVVLDPTDSFGTIDGAISNLNWVLTSRPTTSVAQIENGDTLRPHFIPDLPGNYEATLQLTLADGTTQDIVFGISTENSAPVARIRARGIPDGSPPVLLDGSASFDIDGDDLTYAWSLVSGPVGHSAVFTDATAVLTDIALDEVGTYVVGLEVQDGTGLVSNNAFFEIDYASNFAADQNDQLLRNVAPTADGRFDQMVAALNEGVVIDPFASTDIDGDTLGATIEIISQPAGAIVSLTTNTVNQSLFTSETAGDFLLAVNVSDNARTATDHVLISVGDDAAVRPVAQIGAVTSTSIGSQITLDGSQSYDFNGGQVFYEWAVLSAPVGSISNLASASEPFASLVPDLEGFYVVQLRVVDGAGLASVPTTQLIRVEGALPQANAGLDQLVGDQEIALDGSLSTGDLGAYSWSAIGLAGPLTGSIAGADQVNAGYVLASETSRFRDVIQTANVYHLKRAQTDGLCQFDTRIPLDFVPSTANEAVEITLHGRGKQSESGGLIQVWEIENKGTVTRSVTLEDEDGNAFLTVDVQGRVSVSVATPDQGKQSVYAVVDGAIVADDVGHKNPFNRNNPVCVSGNYSDVQLVVQLIVGDATIYSLPDTAFIGDANLRPVLTAPDALEPAAGEAITLNAVPQARDDDLASLSFQWKLLSSPDGSTLNLSQEGSELTFVPDRSGLFLVQLEVTDGEMIAEPAVFAIEIANTAPVAIATGPQEVFVGETILLDGSGSFDPDGDALTFSWTVIARPADSISEIPDPFGVSASFTPDQKGEYTFQLITSDFGASSAPSVITVVVPNRAPEAILTAPAETDSGVTALLDGTASSDPDADTLTYAISVLSQPDGANPIVTDLGEGQFEFLANTAGSYTLQLLVDDGEAQDTVTTTLSVSARNAAPVLADLASPYTVETGLKLAIDLVGTDPDDDPITYFAQPVPLPTGMTLDVVTGALLFSPETGQEGTYTLTVGVSDGLLTDEVEIVVEVIAPTAGETTVAGRVLDAVDFANGIETPLSGMPVRLGSAGQATVTGTDGAFGFTGLSSGTDLVLVEPDANGGPGGYLSTQRPIRVTEDQNRTINPDLLLVPLNEGCSIVTAGIATQLTGASSGVQVTIPADSILDANGDLYEGEVCLAALPQQTDVPGFPEDTLACQVFGVSAAGASFTSGLQLSAPNFDNLPETTQLSIWQQNANTGNFGRSANANVDAGATTVSGSMAPIEGGTLFAFLPQSPRITASADQPTGMHTLNMFDGDLNEMYTLPGYRAFNQTQQISLSYHSQAANPVMIVAGDVTIAANASLPVTLSSRVEVGGLSIDDTIEWTPRQGLDGSAPALVGEEVVLRQSTPVDASQLPSARYDYQFVAQAQYDCSMVEASFGAEFYVRNESDSPYGTGWSIDELQELVQNPDGSVAIIDDDTVTTFDPEPTLSEFDGNPSVLPAIGPQGIVTGDFDGNGQMELAWADSGTGTIQIAEYNGLGEVQIMRVIDLAEPNEVSATGYTPNLRDLAIGDLTGDSQDDFAYTLYLGQEAGFLNDAGALVPTLNVIDDDLDYFGTFVEIADFNNDGFDDLAIGQAGTLNFGSSQSVIDWAPGGPDGLGTFQRIKNDTFLTREIAFQSASGDVNGDGQDELFVRAPRGFEVFQFDGNSGQEVFSNRLDNSVWNFALGEFMAVADYNNDGLDDVVLSSASKLVVLFNTTSADGAVTFGPYIEIARPAGLTTALYIGSADTNGDGIDDLVASGNDELYIYIANGDGTFQPFLTSPLGHAVEFLEIADINNDGSLDLVSSQRFSVTVDYSNPSDEGTFIAGNGEFSTLTALPDGGWERRYKNGMTVTFDVDGRQTATTDTYGNSTTFAYDTDGRLTGKTDQVGGETLFGYDSNGLLASITYPDGRVTEFDLSENGTLLALTEPTGSQVSFTYDDSGQLVSSTNQNGNTATYEYSATGDLTGANFPDGSSIANQVANSLGLVDGLGNVPPNPLVYVNPEDRITIVTDRKGEVTEVEVNEFGATIRVTDPIGRTTNVTRDNNNLVSQVERPSAAGGRRIDEMDYDLLGNVTLMTEAVGTDVERSTQYEYEPVFNKVTSMIDPDGFTSTYEYDGFGQPTSMTNPEGGIMGYVYSSEGQMLSQTDENGNETTYSYDGQLNMSEMTYADGSVTELVYDVSGNNTVQMDAVGTPEERHQVRTFDALNRVLTVEITGADGVQIEGITSYTYAPNGNLASVTDETDLVTTMSYDSLERLVAMDDPAEGLIQRVYNEAGEVISHINGDGETHLYTYDSISRMTETIDAGGFIKSFNYDDLDNVTMVTDGRGGATDFTYDVLNRMIDRTNPLGLTMSRDYDLRDNLTTLTREDGLTETASYDGLGRRTQVITPDNTLTYGYDPRSNLTEAADNDSRVAFTYDERNRLETTTTDGTVGPQPGVTLTYTYDALDRRTSMSDSLGGQTLYAYDSEDRLTDLTAPWGTVYEFGYDDVGRRTSLLSSTGRASTYSYENGLLATLNHVQSGVTLTDLIYGYDVDGQLTSITDNLNPNASWAISYDSLNRLIQVAEGAVGDIPTPVEDYAYDEEGNRSASHLSAFYSSNAHNQLLEDDNYTYTYDDRGNRITRTDKASGAVETYSYDSQNRLVGYVSDVATASYALDRRIAKTVDGVEMAFIYDGSDVLFDFENTLLSTRWQHGARVDEPLAFERYSAATTVGQGDVYAIYVDRLGSPLEVVNVALGQTVASYEYDSFGHRGGTGTLAQRFGFTGRELDDESGLYYYRARHYDPVSGSFIQRDPIGFAAGDANLYAYVWNDPHNWTDPTGLSPTVEKTLLTGGFLAGGLYYCHVSGICSAAADAFSDALANSGSGIPGVPGVGGGGGGSGPGNSQSQDPISAIASGLGAAVGNIFGNITGAIEEWWTKVETNPTNPPPPPSSDPGNGGNGGPPLDPLPDPDLETLLITTLGIAAIEYHSDFGFITQLPGSNGPIDIATHLRIEGDVLHLDDFVIYGQGPGTSSISELRPLVEQLGINAGVRQVQVHGYRVSGANPGREVTFTFNVP